MSEVVSARLPREKVRLVEEIAGEERVDKSTILERALEHYTREWKLKKAVELYRDGLVTLSRAAEIAEISIWEMSKPLFNVLKGSACEVVKDRDIVPIGYESVYEVASDEACAACN